MPPLMMNDYDQLTKFSPNTAQARGMQKNFNFSELSEEDQKKIIEYIKENSRSNSRDNSFLSRNGKHAVRI